MSQNKIHSNSNRPFFELFSLTQTYPEGIGFGFILKLIFCWNWALGVVLQVLAWVGLAFNLKRALYSTSWPSLVSCSSPLSNISYYSCKAWSYYWRAAMWYLFIRDFYAFSRFTSSCDSVWLDSYDYLSPLDSGRLLSYFLLDMTLLTNVDSI